jgi:hypothetical protein
MEKSQSIAKLAKALATFQVKVDRLRRMQEILSSRARMLLSPTS